MTILGRGARAPKGAATGRWRVARVFKVVATVIGLDSVCHAIAFTLKWAVGEFRYHSRREC